MVARAALAVCLIWPAIADPPAAAADGARIESRKTTPQVVAESDVIAVVRVLAVRHRYAKRRAYRAVHRYVERYRVKVKIERFLHGGDTFAAEHRRKRVFWVDGDAHGVPGKWVIIRDYYRSDQRFEALKRGDRFVLYLTDVVGQRGRLEANEIDESAREPAVVKLIAEAAAKRRATARAAAIAGGATPTCSVIDTFKLDGECESPGDLLARHRCARRRTAAMKLGDSGSLVLYCADRRGRRDGAFVSFGTLGAKLRSGAYRRDELEGEIVKWSPAGQVIERRCYRRDVERPCPNSG